MPKTQPGPASDARHDAYVRKVASLLATAESAREQGADAMSIAYQEQAFAIMAKYGIDEALVRKRQDEANPTNAVQATNVMIRLEGKYKPMQAVLLGRISRSLHSKPFQTATKGRIAIQIFGMPDHLRRIQDIWEMLAPQALRGIEQAEPPFGYSHSGELRVYRRNWLAGFGEEIESRIYRAEHLAAQEVGALVLYEGDAKKAEIAMREAHPNWRIIKSRRYYDHSGHSQGVQAGKTAQLQRSID